MFHEWNLYFYYDTEFRSEEQGFRYIMNRLYYEEQSNLNKQIKMVYYDMFSTANKIKVHQVNHLAFTTLSLKIKLCQHAQKLKTTQSK